MDGWMDGCEPDANSITYIVFSLQATESNLGFGGHSPSRDDDGVFALCRPALCAQGFCRLYERIRARRESKAAAESRRLGTGHLVPPLDKPAGRDYATMLLLQFYNQAVGIQILCAGATAALEAVVTLLCTSGDSVLVPTPFYNGFLMDISLRSGVRIVHLERERVSAEGWSGAVAQLPSEVTARLRAIVVSQRGLVFVVVFVLGLIEQQRQKELCMVQVSHPNNPLGQALSTLEMREMLTFAEQRQLHIISDEVSKLAVF